VNVEACETACSQGRSTRVYSSNSVKGSVNGLVLAGGQSEFPGLIVSRTLGTAELVLPPAEGQKVQ
jgi:hypothetical protein